MNPVERINQLTQGKGMQVTRRSFLHLLQCAGFGALLGWKGPMAGEKVVGFDEPSLLLRGRLVHVHDVDATSWDFGSSWYGYHVDQAVVDSMMEEGLLKLTATRNVAKAWSRLVPKYTAGQKFAIKVNFNNFSASGPDPDTEINALIEPVNALIRTMVMFGVPASDISVFDVTHGWHSGSMPQVSFINRCLYPGVNFVYHYGNPNPFSSTEFVEFNPPSSPYLPDLAIANVVVDADYLINMFIPKAHSLAGVTLGFKNHMGSYDHCQEIHTYLPYNYYYKPDYSTFIDVFKNPHFGKKTVLTIGDGLFGNWPGVNGIPKRWNTFGNDAPNSLFLSADPVAIDSVVTDFIEAERATHGSGMVNGTRDFLVLAEQERMGIHESADPWQGPMGSDYKRINYMYINGVK